MENENIIDDAIDTADSPVEDGQGVEVEVAAEATEEGIDLFDYTQYANNMVKLQVDGEEVLVPLQEALAGYQRQSDYTRKTQELSEQKKQIQYAAALQEALEKDPAHTLQLLSEAYGVNTAVSSNDDDWDTDEWDDPASKQLKSLEQRIAAFEQEKAAQELERTIESLQAKYGEAFDPDKVVAKALATGTTDLEAVFKQIAFDDFFAKAQDASKVKTEEQARVDAKRQAAIVSGATSSKSTTPPVTAAPKTVFEAFEQAKKAHNL
jgi:hypothetical protein